jgi:LysM repeat protein
VSAIQAANPGLGYWVYTGQVLYIPSGGSPSYPGNYPPPATGGTYVVQVGDTMAIIANRFGTTVSAIMGANPQIYNPNVIYVGQVINLPTGSSPSYPPNQGNYPPPQKPCNCPQPAPGHELNTAKINYKNGMYIRSEPNGAIIASAENKTTVYYYRNSFFHDGGGCVWVKVKVYPPNMGYFDGWLLVKDQLGKYFTSPQLGG